MASKFTTTIPFLQLFILSLLCAMLAGLTQGRIQGQPMILTDRIQRKKLYAKDTNICVGKLSW